MKNKIILLSTLLLAAILFAGCSSNKTFKSSQKELKLIGNPTTGFTWVVSNSNPEIVSVSEDIQYLGKDGVTGAQSMFTYTIDSKKSGTAELLFEYKRPWEKTEAESIRSFAVTVKENGRIVMKEISK